MSYLQVSKFKNIEKCNEFLKEKGENVRDVTAIYDGGEYKQSGIIYIVVSESEEIKEE
jgi:hypothetical protein